MGVTKQKRSQLIGRAVFIFLALILLVQPLVTIYNQREKFFSTGYEKQYSALKSAYNNSQYAKKKNPTTMSDANFEQFAGGIFLKGLNPILIVHDHPPLGRYIVSLSILLFDNPHTIILPLMLLTVVGFYLLAVFALKNYFIALIPVGIFINEPLFISRLVETPLPEPIQLPFILFALYFFLRAVTSKTDLPWFLLTSLMIGGVISTRFFILGTAMAGSMVLYLLLMKHLRKKALKFILTLPVALLLLVASYFRTIQSGYSPVQVLSIQKYILDYHKSKFVVPFTMWDLLLFNRWHTWWGNRAILSDAQWVVVWPISVILTGITLVLGIKEKFRTFSDGEKFLLLWVLVHLAMLSVGYSTTRYFLPLLPVLYILAAAGVLRLIVWFFPRTQAGKRLAKSFRSHAS